MSVDVLGPAWKTKLGNHPAKEVLACIADQVNADGYGWPKTETIVERTELSVRMVKRVLQVFNEIGLVIHKRVKHERGNETFQVNLSMLGKDLREVFAERYEAAQGKKRAGDVCETSPEDVCETGQHVCETGKHVCETSPLHPLYGGTVIEQKVNGDTLPGYTEPQGVPVGVLRRIVCAHPSAALRSLTPGEVTKPDLEAVRRAVDAECAQTGVSPGTAADVLLALTQQVAEAVSRWPPGERKYLRTIVKFFDNREYRIPTEEWTHGTDRKHRAETGGDRQQRIDEEARASHARLTALMGARQASHDGVGEARPHAGG